jgi:hypothetical protein
LSAAGLNLIEQTTWGDDSVQFWSRTDLPWPMDLWP